MWRRCGTGHLAHCPVIRGDPPASDLPDQHQATIGSILPPTFRNIPLTYYYANTAPARNTRGRYVRSLSAIYLRKPEPAILEGDTAGMPAHPLQRLSYVPIRQAEMSAHRRGGRSGASPKITTCKRRCSDAGRIAGRARARRAPTRANRSRRCPRRAGRCSPGSAPAVRSATCVPPRSSPLSPSAPVSLPSAPVLGRRRRIAERLAALPVPPPRARGAPPAPRAHRRR